METLGEIIATFIAGLIELTVHLAVLAIGPIRYLISPSYRRLVRRKWRGHPTRQGAQLLGGSFILLLFLGAIGWWVSVLAGDEKQPPDPAAERRAKREALVEKIVEKVRTRKDRQQ